MTDEQPAKRPAPIRLLSLEGLFGAFGLFSLGTGLWQGELMPVFWGATILVGLAILWFIRRRDWQKHWEDVEKQRNRHA